MVVLTDDNDVQHPSASGRATNAGARAGTPTKASPSLDKMAMPSSHSTGFLMFKANSGNWAHAVERAYRELNSKYRARGSSILDGCQQGRGPLGSYLTPYAKDKPRYPNASSPTVNKPGRLKKGRAAGPWKK